MRPETQRRLAMANCLFVVALLLVSGVMDAITTFDGNLNSNIGADLIVVPVILLMTVMGALIISKHPGHLIGVGMCLTGFLGGVSNLVDAYATYTILTDPGALPAQQLMTWVEAWIWVPTVLPGLTLLFLLFPDGKLVSPRWRRVAILDIAITSFVLLTVAFRPGPFEDFPQLVNPLGIGSDGGVLDVANEISLVSLAPAILLSGAGLVLRFRRSTGTERQQFKWLTAAAILAGVVFSASIILAFFGIVILGYAIVPIFAAVPVAMGLAVLRYRLYDVDRIINRTLVYGFVTVLLALTYFGLVVGLQFLLGSFTSGSGLAVALTTLIVAALFFPLRQRVQGVVDRRFNRRAYDAARTIEAFSARLRQEVDLDSLRYELLSVVDETMEPAGVSLWLRDAEARR